jgi:hypothetical protein
MFSPDASKFMEQRSTTGSNNRPASCSDKGARDINGGTLDSAATKGRQNLQDGYGTLFTLHDLKLT